MGRRFGNLVLGCLIISIIFNNIPRMFGITDPFVENCFYLITKLLLLLFLTNSLVRAGYFSDGRQTPDWKNLLIFLPTLVLIIGFPISSLVDGSNTIFWVPFLWDNENFWLYFLALIVESIYDELLFRLVIQYSWFSNKTKIARILLSALVYAGFMVLSNGFGTLLFSIVELIALFGGAFILGCITGFLIEYTRSVYPCIVFHLLFSLFAGPLTSSFTVAFVFGALINALSGFNVSGLFSISDFILAGCEAFTILYLVYIYNFYYKKREY